MFFNNHNTQFIENFRSKFMSSSYSLLSSLKSTLHRKRNYQSNTVEEMLKLRINSSMIRIYNVTTVTRWTDEGQ